MDRRSALGGAAGLAAWLVAGSAWAQAGGGRAVAGAAGTAGAATWPAAAFEARTLPQLAKALGIAVPVESPEVTLTAPDIAEDGANVPITLACARPGVRRLLLGVEKNPNLLAASFEVNDFVDANFGTRIKMAQSSPVLAVAVMADGRVLFTQKEVKVTLGGCGN